MARHWIQINSVDDIDTSKITLANINNRYIDKEGNRYATRFNMRTHKVEIVRIAVGLEEAKQAKNQKIEIPESKKEAKSDAAAKPESKAAPASYPVPEWVRKRGIEPDESMDPDTFVATLEEETNKFTERFRGIIQNLRHSEVSAKADSGQDYIVNLGNTFDREVLDQLSETQRLVTEFQRFPKESSHYLANLPRKQKEHVEQMSEEEQIDYFRALYIGEAYLKALESGLHLLEGFDEVTAQVDTQAMQKEKQTFFENALQSAEYLKQQVYQEAARVVGWMKKASVI